MPQVLNREAIYNFLLDSIDDRVSIEGFAYEPIKLGGMYWSLTAIALLKGKINDIVHPKANKTLESMAIEILERAKNSNGAFGFAPKHSSNLIATHYGILVLGLLDKLELLDREGIIEFIANLQNKDGSFSADQFGEADCRHSYSAIVCLHILNGLDKIDLSSAISFILSCKNFDGGFGWQPKTESHAAAAFCCIGALSVLEAVYLVDRDKLGFWLAERQTKSGGFNGRPEKAPDICYSWWILSALCNIDRVEWICGEKLIEFILESQNENDGGIAFFPGYMGDICHTFFALCGIALINNKEYNLQPVHPIYATTMETANRLLKYQS
ncbi:geranylgeranyl transferase type II beta subunit, putative [Theileria equi strain WA]|uniref:Geranylgeranyl transferase type-2 subunit beta n=1 Tax=Theileria equi strain WA TaxID=1537102 RepID=L1LDA2_THEEQ|nr:geranylgeranyl transferase type II beta subunit, putative [Theileria equi strain WA]EKX73311.1 geranylgeranyl transferase type II beta subunit, putative [Theileria equi strain WA]|eukprot:XP_004832763.1 geranylgeranyl transferase type II beta subunit, putative [Theileria equi strain WA]